MASILQGLKIAYDWMKENGRGYVNGISNGIMNMLQWKDGGFVLGDIDMKFKDDVVTEEDARREQILRDALGASVKEIVASYIFNESLDLRIWNRALVSSRMRLIFLTQILEFGFGPGETHIDPDKKMTIIGKDDHASFHLDIRKFANYENLLRHEFFKFGTCTVKTQQISPDYTGTTLCFYPCSKDTTGISNEMLTTCCNQVESIANAPINYTIRTVAPAFFREEKIIQEGKPERTKIEAIEPRVFPNIPFRSSYIKGKIDEKSDEFLSYGTLVFLKSNVSDYNVSLRFLVTMEFMVWDQDLITDYEYKTGGPGSDSGSAPENPHGSVPGRRLRKN